MLLFNLWSVLLCVIINLLPYYCIIIVNIPIILIFISRTHVRTYEGVAQLEVSIPHGECLQASALNCKPWNFVPPSLCENAAEDVFGTPHSCLPTLCPTHRSHARIVLLESVTHRDTKLYILLILLFWHPYSNIPLTCTHGAPPVLLPGLRSCAACQGDTLVQPKPQTPKTPRPHDP